jgi:excisionase family DNA binding protein
MLTSGNKNDMSRQSLLNVTEVAHLLHVHPNTIRLWSRIGVLKAYRIGKRRDYRFTLEDIKTFLYKDGEPPT